MSAAAVLPPKPQMRTVADPMVIRIIPELAEQIGLNESVLLLQIAFWIGSPNTGRFIDGHWWTWQSIRDMQEKAFPYLSISTINRAATKLIRDGYLMEANYNERKYDKTRWFALNVEKIKTLKGVTVVESDKTLVHFEPRSTQNETRSNQNEPRSTQDEPPIPEKPTKTSSKRSTKTDKTLPANPEPVAPEPVAASSVFQSPESIEEIILDIPHGEPGNEQNQPPEARSIFCFEASRVDSASTTEPAAQFSSMSLEASSTNQQPAPAQSLPVEGEQLKTPPDSAQPPIIPKHNDLTHDDRIIPGLKPGDPPLYKPDDVWKRVQEVYEDVTGLPMSGNIQDDIQDGIKLRGEGEVIKLLESARNAKKSRVGMVVRALENWHKESKLPGHRGKPKDDIPWNDDGSLGGYT